MALHTLERQRGERTLVYVARISCLWAEWRMRTCPPTPKISPAADASACSLMHP